MKRNILPGLLFTFYMLLLLPRFNAQVGERVSAAFTEYQQSRLREKLFVHTNRPDYLTGESIWFKLYSTDGMLGQPLDLSKVAYLELLDPENKVVEQVKTGLKEGFGSGSVYLPATLKSGNYIFRAYTSWMKNFDASGYFEKKITVINPQEEAILPGRETPAEFDIQFFPEGGTLVTGLKSKVACKVTGKNGLGVDYSAALLNDRNDTISRFNSQKFGMGTFYVQPDAGVSYHCIFTINGKHINKLIDKIENKGYVLHIADTTQGKVAIDVFSNAQTTGPVYLIAYSNQVVRTAQGGEIRNGSTRFIVDKQKLSEGISTFTLFNASGQPVAGRVYFSPVYKRLNLLAATTQNLYTTRNKVSVDLTAADPLKHLVPANLSLSVYRLPGPGDDDQAHILSSLWLQSELRGPVESADYYFQNTSEETLSALDDLMLTNGWRRYIWDEVLNQKSAVLKFLPENEGQFIAGKVLDKNGNPQKGAELFFSVPGKALKIANAETKEDGSFVFNIKDLYGTNEVVIQVGELKDTTSSITLFNPFSEQYSTTQFGPFNPGLFKANNLKERSLANQVQNTYYGAKLRAQFRYDVDTSSFYLHPLKTYLMEDYVRFPTMHEIFREFVSQVYMVRESDEIQLRLTTMNGLLKSSPLTILNGVPVFSARKIMALDPHQFKALEIVNHRYLYGNRMEDGILNIITNKADMAGYELEPNALILDYKGLQLRTEFYSPVYETKAQEESRMPDFRTALAWVPDFTTGPDGKKQLVFYTSDQPGIYVGVVQGITSKGFAGYTTFKFEVRN